MSKEIENTIANEIVALITSNKGNSEEHIDIRSLMVGVSIRMFEKPVMKIICGENKKYISVSPSVEQILNDFTSIKTETIKSDPWIRILFNSQDELKQLYPLFLKIYDEAYLMFSSEHFGCCSKYEKCSDEKRCIHPDQLFAKGCAYRYHLIEGRIFYGENCNS